jgi:hypothetical protein
MRITILTVLAALSSMAVATAANASTVSVQDGTLLVAAGPGETNEVYVSQRVPPGSTGPTEYAVRDTSVGTIAGPGCGPDPTRPPQSSDVVCPAAAVARVVITLGDGDDGAGQDVSGIPVTVYGELGNDRIAMFARPDTLADGGEGNDDLQGGDDLRGGPGDDKLTGSRLLDGGEGNDILRKTGGKASGRLAGGPGDDSLESGDGWADQLQCGDGRDVITGADDSDRNDGTCESGKGVAGKPAAAKAQVTVFELPKASSRPGRDGRLAVWVRCSVPKCSVTVRIFTVGDPGIKGFARFRHPPLLHLTVGTTAKLVRLRLSPAQRRALNRADPTAGIGATVITRRPGADARMLTNGFFCRRADPCGAYATSPTHGPGSRASRPAPRAAARSQAQGAHRWPR